MKEALAALTPRGRAFLAAGAAIVFCSLLLGQKDLLRVGVLLVALPLVTTVVIARARYQLSCSREISPRRVSVGEPTTVTLHLGNMGRMPTGVLLLEDQVPYVLGARPRFVVDHMGPRWRHDVSYEIRSDLRGRFSLGPLRVRVSDPFGFVELTREFPARDTVVVTPQVHPLPNTRLSGEWSGTGDNRPRAFAAAGTEDVTVREYRQGDDLRRVHWASTARTGELMVRREEQPWQSRGTIMLDTRKVAHLGLGPSSSLEWAISAAASVGAHLSRRAFTVRLATDADVAGSSGGWHDRGLSAVGEIESLLEILALARPSDRVRLDVHATPDFASPGLVVAILGRLDPVDLQALGRLRYASNVSLALLLDVSAWREERSTRPASQPNLPRPAAVQSSAAALRRQGWQVALARPGDNIGAVWESLASGLGRSALLPAEQPTLPGADGRLQGVR